MIPELSDYLIGKVGTGVLPADLPREESSALGAVTVDHQSGLMCALVKPNAELGEPVGEYSLFVNVARLSMIRIASGVTSEFSRARSASSSRSARITDLSTAGDVGKCRSPILMAVIA